MRSPFVDYLLFFAAITVSASAMTRTARICHHHHHHHHHGRTINNIRFDHIIDLPSSLFITPDALETTMEYSMKIGQDAVCRRLWLADVRVSRWRLRHWPSSYKVERRLGGAVHHGRGGESRKS